MHAATRPALPEPRCARPQRPHACQRGSSRGRRPPPVLVQDAPTTDGNGEDQSDAKGADKGDADDDEDQDKDEEDTVAADGTRTISKKRLRKESRLTVAELKQLVRKPEVVEVSPGGLRPALLRTGPGG